ncbi:alpha/beta fold hydrolase [Haliangium sp.]|uniref:alpha/beta fold hydrolase n=1 Tax=Haliangium sp. TaxID=2663208 RepID=UPI003D144283
MMTRQRTGVARITPLLSSALVRVSRRFSVGRSVGPSRARSVAPLLDKALPLLLLGAAMALGKVAMAAPDIPRYERGACSFEGADALGARIECGTLLVHEDPLEPDQRIVKVAVAVLKASGGTVRPDPLVYLSGGPGEGGLSAAASWLAHPLAQHRDIILVDQRGTGRSDPLCPDLAKEVTHILAEDLTPAQDIARNRAAAGRCLTSLRERRRDPNAYSSAATAADLETLRELLGYEEWNLLGVSYGTRLALTAMRDVPDRIRSVVLDSPFAPQDDFYELMAGAFAPALARLAADCTQDARCAQGETDLNAETQAFLDELEQRPLVLRIDDPDLFPNGIFVLNRQDLQMLLGFQIRDAGVRAVLPALVRAWRRGHTESLALLVKIHAQVSSSIDLGKYYAVQCFEEMPFSARAGALDATRPATAFLDAATAVCADWTSAPADARENQPVDSAIPTLLLAGELDFGTSTANARRTAAYLSRGTVIEVPGAGHSVSGHGCVAQVMAAFVDDPDQPLDASCMAAYATPPPLGELRLSSGPLRLFRGLQGGQPGGLLGLAGALMVLALALVVWPLRGLWRRRRRSRADPGSRPGDHSRSAEPVRPSSRRLKTLAYVALGLAALAAWIFIVGLAAAIGGLMDGDYALAVVAGLPSDTGALFVLPKATALLVIGAVTATARCWRDPSWSRFERVHYLLTMVGAVAVLAILVAYELF